MQRFYDESKEAALLAVDSSPQGLTQAEAQAKTALGVAEKAALAQQASKDTNPAGGGGLKAGGEG